MLTIKTPSKYIERLRKILIEKEIIAKNYRILTTDRYGYIPTKEDMSSDILEIVKEELENNIKNEKAKDIDIFIVEKNLEEVKKQPRSILECLKGKLTDKEIEDLKTSFDIIGDLIILEIPENLQYQKDTIGKAALYFTKRKSIFMKKSAIKGLTRTRQLEHIAGEKNSETVHKENKIKLKLNINNVYFSPRLATERKRIANQVKNGEDILDMFAGIGPFPILIAKDHKVNIYAVDINKEAIKYMKKNIKLNNLKGKITPILGSINPISKKKFIKHDIKFNRIIMNLPTNAKDFLGLAISLINNNGIIHYYEFSDSYDSGIKKIKKIAKKHNKNIEILATRKVKSNSPKKWHIVIDAKILKKN